MVIHDPEGDDLPSELDEEEDEGGRAEEAVLGMGAAEPEGADEPGASEGQERHAKPEGAGAPADADERSEAGRPAVMVADVGGASQNTAGSEAAAVKANTLNRCIAKFIDILIALLLSRLPGYIGFCSGLLYIGIADGVMGGRSVGKKIAGLRVYSKKTGKRADFRASILRNSTIGVFYILSFIPFVGWAAGILGLGFELLLIIGNPEGMRLGDEIALTVVKDEE
jgi:uncharacterized RDD family membrane protein YckC